MEFKPEKKINTENTKNTCCSKTFNKILSYKIFKFLSFPVSYIAIQFIAFKLYHTFCMNSFTHLILYSHSPLCIGFLNIMNYSSQLYLAFFTGTVYMIGNTINNYFPTNMEKIKNANEL
tara:strand:+ start:1057 stop:1413 length:357 start_codon:yes stop_codon:yes gene_type:complete